MAVRGWKKLLANRSAHAISEHYRDFEHAYVYWIWLRDSASYVKMLLTNFDEFVYYLYFLFFAQMLDVFDIRKFKVKKSFWSIYLSVTKIFNIWSTSLTVRLARLFVIA